MTWKKRIYQSLIFTLFLVVSGNSFGQRNVADSAIGTPWVGIQYSGTFTGGDLADRYGYLNHVGFFAGYKTAKNWVLGVDANFIFGGDVRVNGLFDDLRDSKGNITDVNGDIAIVRALARGMNVNATVGKIFPVLSPNDNSGIYVNLGVGYMVHRIRVETQEHVVPSLELEYRKGYDRLTSGANIHQFVGYSFMANGGVLNFYAGFYANQGLTYNRRTVNFDQPDTPVSKDLRLELQYGFRAGWLIPIYKRQPKEFYYN